MKRLLLDQGLAPRAATILYQYGFDASHVAEVGLDHADDILILERARNAASICVTLDHDFHAHHAIAGHGQPSVVLLLVQGMDTLRQAQEYW